MSNATYANYIMKKICLFTTGNIIRVLKQTFLPQSSYNTLQCNADSYLTNYTISQKGNWISMTKTQACRGKSHSQIKGYADS